MVKTAAKADTSWIPAFREKYEAWFQEARSLIEAHEYQKAFKGYPFVKFERAPWSPVRTPLSAGRLGVVTTAAIYRKGIDPPFVDTPGGDDRIIEIPPDVDARTLDTAHTHIPQGPIQEDVNVALPIDHLRDFVRERRIGELAPRMFSLVGYRIRADEVATQTAAAIAAAMAQDQVTHALIVPV